MMDLDEAIQHCKEQVQEQAKKGCYSCAEEHQQLADWLKELKAYREQGGDAISRQAVLDIINFEDKWLLGAKSHNVDTKTAFWTMKSKIFNLPSVTPQQRSGRWIDDEFGSKCSCCGIHTHLDKFDRLYNWLNDMRFSIAPDETVTDDNDRNGRLAQMELLDAIMAWMVVQLPKAE